MRAKMIDWMVEVFSVFEYLQDTFFLAVYILDWFMAQTPRILEDKDIHLIGLVSMYVSSKHEEIWPLFVEHVRTWIGHGSFSAEAIKSMELEMSQTLDWRFTLVTPEHFIDYIDTHLRNTFKSRHMSHLLERLRLQTLQYVKLALIHYKSLEFKPSELAIGAYQLSLEW